MIIILDFDRTIFDTEQLYLELERHAIDVFDIEATAKLSLDRMVYDDSVEFLKKYAHHTLVLLTFGNEKYQKVKVEKSGLAPFFQKIIYTGEHMKAPLIKEIFDSRSDVHEKVVFVDDTTLHLDETKKLVPEVVLIHINRADTHPHFEIQKEYIEVKDLSGVDVALQSLEYKAQ